MTDPPTAASSWSARASGSTRAAARYAAARPAVRRAAAPAATEPADASSGSTSPGRTGRSAEAAAASSAALCPTTAGSRAVRSLNGTGRPAARVRRSTDNGDLVDREGGDQLVTGVRDDQHLLQTHAELVHLAVLRLQREHHPRLDLDRMIQGPDP